ncbi:MAG: hypothetical protein AVDCRST_MAG41-3236 [uncultured Corynebacteriales bacterium]|uniref:Uncharacterized protein n=1 Tax=uncultured Mycobacteriales bacterium TaxID=581187 RepID=A0A6J4JEC9_9ACTN|nr:MAG: hypothetical protein AVDCRST_MAG41-3236 [uncultured Corynebacteriales bacterium]
MLILGALAAALLVAGLLPWLTGGETTIRMLALPMFLAGLLVSGVALRVHAAGRQAPPARAAGLGCDGCMCGQQPAGCATPAALDRSASTS